MDTIEERLDRIESTLAIQQLPVRYGLAMDSRDIDAWVGLFIEDVNCGRRGTGREALKAYVEPILSGFYRCQHFICGHKIDFDDADHASGSVYCRAEHEDGDQWIVMAICYFDTYERRNGEWFFVRRNEKHWYARDELARPAGPNFSAWPAQPAVEEPRLPAEFPQWRKFWDRMGPEVEAKRTRYPAGLASGD